MTNTNPKSTPLKTVDAADIDLPTEPADHTVAGVLLAAGTSTRFGEANKLLARVDGEPIVRHAARTLVDSSLEPVIVVLGHEPDRVRAALSGGDRPLEGDPNPEPNLRPDLDLEFVTNEAYATGQAASVRAGVLAAREDDRVDAVLIALGDMPFVQVATIEALVVAHRAGVGDAIAAAHEGVRGNPVLFDERHFDALTAIDGDIGGRQILLEDEWSRLLEVPDSGVRRDIDTRDALQRLD